MYRVPIFPQKSGNFHKYLLSITNKSEIINNKFLFFQILSNVQINNINKLVIYNINKILELFILSKQMKLN